MPYLYMPPNRRETHQLKGSLQYSFMVTETVWKDADGVWQHQEVPPGDTLLAAQVVLAGRPQTISDSLAAELISAGVGTCVHL